MIDSFEDFCLWMYVIVDDVWQEVRHQFKRPGPEPECSDSELLTMVLVGECCGWDMETDMVQHWRAHRRLFPKQPSQSRLNRRRRNLMDAFGLIRRAILSELDLAAEQICVMDSMPIPVVAFHHAPRASREWVTHAASFGRVSSKRLSFYGYKLHLMTTLQGLIVDFALAPAHLRDLPVGLELLDNYADLIVMADKAYIHRPVAQELRQTRGIDLLTLPRSNQQLQVPRHVHRPFNTARLIIETIHSQLTEQFRAQTNHALSFWGLCTRLQTKLTAHTLCIFVNRLLGNPDFLHIKALAFPN